MNIFSWLKRKPKEEIIPEGHRKCDKCGQVFPEDELYEVLIRRQKHGVKYCEDCLNEMSGIPIE